MTTLRPDRGYADPVVTSFDDVIALLNGTAVSESGSRLYLSSVAQTPLFYTLFREVARLHDEVAALRAAIGSDKT